MSQPSNCGDNQKEMKVYKKRKCMAERSRVVNLRRIHEIVFKYMNG